MSVEELGKRLLGEVENERMDEVLRRASKTRSDTSHIPLFNIPSLDALVNTTRPVPAIPVLPRDHLWTSSPPEPPRHPQPPKPSAYPFIDITSPTSHSGKTHLLYLIAALAVLPSSFHDIPLHGLSRAIVVLDTDGRFDVTRLATVMRSYINSTTATAHTTPDILVRLDADALKHIIRQSLSHIHILRPQSLDHTLHTLRSLPAYLFNTAAHASGPRRLHSIILDSASTFLWSARAAADTAQLTRDTGVKGVAETYAGLATALVDMGRRFGCMIICTSWSVTSKYVRNTAGGVEEALQSIMPRSYLAATTLRLCIRRRPVAPFAVAMSLEQAAAERDARYKVVKRGLFDVEVLGAGRGGFAVAITGAGVRVPVGEEES